MKEYKINWSYIVKLVEKLTGDDISGLDVELSYEPDEYGNPKSLIIRVKEEETEEEEEIEFVSDFYDEEDEEE